MIKAMAHDVQFIANIGAWVPQVPLQDPEQIEAISDRVLASPVQQNGDIISGDASDDEINNVWPFLMSSSVMAYGSGDNVPHMPNHNKEEEGKSRSHMQTLYLDPLTILS